MAGILQVKALAWKMLFSAKSIPWPKCFNWCILQGTSCFPGGGWEIPGIEQENGRRVPQNKQDTGRWRAQKTKTGGVVVWFGIGYRLGYVTP